MGPARPAGGHPVGHSAGLGRGCSLANSGRQAPPGEPALQAGLPLLRVCQQKGEPVSAWGLARTYRPVHNSQTWKQPRSISTV